MKTKLFTLFLLSALSLGFISQTYGQLNVLKVNPLSLALLTANGQYERALNKDMSVQLGLFFTGYAAEVNSTRIGFSGIGLTPEFRYYFSNPRDDAPRGFYFGPYVRYRNFNLASQEDLNEGLWAFTSIGGGIVIGQQWLIADVFAIDVFVGPGMANNSFRTIVESSNIDPENIPGLGKEGRNPVIRLGVSLGAAF